MMLRLPGIPYLLNVHTPSGTSIIRANGEVLQRGTFRVREPGPLRSFWQQPVLPLIPFARQQPLREFTLGRAIALLFRILPAA